MHVILSWWRQQFCDWGWGWCGQPSLSSRQVSVKIVLQPAGKIHVHGPIFGAPCGFSGRFEDANLSLKTEMKICSNLHWKMKMWKTQFSAILKNEDVKNLIFCVLKNEDKTLPHLLKMKNAFWKKLKTEDLKNPVKYVKKMKTASFAGSPMFTKLHWETYDQPSFAWCMIMVVTLLHL